MDDLSAITAYHERRMEVDRRVKARGRGTQFKISLALEVAPSLVSSVLSGKYHDPKILSRIEEWLEANP